MSILAKFATVGGATMASRVLGFVREATIAAFLGAGPVADAFYAAFRFPNLFRRLFAEGAFNAAFIPMFSRELEGNGRKAAKKFAEQILSVLLVILLSLTALAMIFMPLLVDTVVAARFDPASDKFDLTVLLTRIMFPYLAAMSLVAMASGIMNSLRQYFLAAFAPVLLNIALIAALYFSYSAGFSDRQTGTAMAIGVVVSGFLQLGLLIWGVARNGFALRLRKPQMTPQVKRLLVLAIPAAITGGITQINLLVGQNIASVKAGAIAVINYADRLFQLPFGVIGIGIGVVLLPELSRALKSDNLGQAQLLQNRSLEFGLGITIPAAIGFAIIPTPIVALVFERGEFSREITLITANVLQALAFGLPAAVLIKIFTPAFYARENMRAPMWYSAISVSVNIIVSLLLFPTLGVVGIGIATSLAGWTNATLLAGHLWAKSLFRPSGETVKRLALILLASGLMGAILYGANRILGDAMLNGNLLKRAGLVLAVIGGSVIVYFAATLASGAIDREKLMRLVRRS